jgi:hypothetical protein
MSDYSLQAVTLKLERQFKLPPLTETLADNERLARALSLGQRHVPLLISTRPRYCESMLWHDDWALSKMVQFCFGFHGLRLPIRKDLDLHHFGPIDMTRNPLQPLLDFLYDNAIYATLNLELFGIHLVDSDVAPSGKRPLLNVGQVSSTWEIFELTL